MPIEYKFETEKELLKVYASGVANNMEETYDYAKAIIEMAVKQESKKLLCNEKKLKHELGILDTFLFAKKTREAAPRVVRVALLVDKNELCNLEFYETVISNRGLFIFITSDYKEAMEWLYK